MLKALNEIKVESPLVNELFLSDFRLEPNIKKQLSSTLGLLGYDFYSYTSSFITEKSRNGKPANYAVIPNQYFIYACKMYEFATELYKYFVIFDKIRPYANSLIGSSEYIEHQIKSDLSIKSIFHTEEDIALFSRFIDKDNANYRLDSKCLINDKGAPRGSKDCFGSVILKKINLPDASSNIFGRLVYDLSEHKNVYINLLEQYEKTITHHFGSPINTPSLLQALPKPFLLLAGISGTGKTRFVREQAKASGDLSATYCLTSVRPDWHEPSDLLGYHSRLSGKTDYVVTDVLQFIAKAWRALVDAGLSLSTEPLGGQGERLLVSGDKTQLQAVPSYWLCLDEMNLAPVEQYFADK